MAQVQGIEFNKFIKTQELQCVYMLFGEEKYFLKDSQARLEKLVPVNKKETFNFIEFSDSSTVDDIADAAYAMPFMAEKKLVIVKDFNVETKSSNEIKKLNELLSDLNPSTVLIFSYPTLIFKQTAKWKELIKNINTGGVVAKFEVLESQQLSKFIQKLAKNNGYSISKYNCDKIIEYVGNDMNNIKNEVNKLCSLSSNEEITTEIIENSVVKNLETTVFILVKSIISSNYANAYQQLDLLFANKEEPVAILARIIDDFIDLYRVKAAVEAKKPATTPAEYANYKGKEFRLRNSAKYLHNFSNEKLVKCLDLLMESDLLLKSSQVSGRIVIEELIAKLKNINEGDNRY